MKATKKILAVIICILTLVSAVYIPVSATMTQTVSKWDGNYPAANASATFSGGDGSQETPYLLSSATDVAQLAVNVRSKTKYTGKYFKLMCDLDLDSKPWKGIGGHGGSGDEYRFEGYFDGDGHIIHNFALNDNTYQGFFGHIGNGAVIENIGIASGNVTLTKGERSGMLIGLVKGTATVRNCFNRADATITMPTGNWQFGMIVGASMSLNNAGKLTVENCYNTGNATVAGSTGGCIFGQIVGRASVENGTTIKNCYASGDITVSSVRSTATQDNDAVGGIVGFNAWSAVAMTDCSFSGDISISESSTGTVPFLGAMLGAQRAYKVNIVGGSYYVTGDASAVYGSAKTASDVTTTATASTSPIALSLANEYFMTGENDLVSTAYQQGITDKSKIRFACELVGDYSAYKQVGFEVEMIYGGQTATAKLMTTNIYSSLKANSQTETPADGNVFVAYGIEGVPTEGEAVIKFTPIAELEGGIYCRGTQKTVTVTNGVIAE